MKRPFHETTWSEVEVGDVLLIAWASFDKIVKVEIKQCESVMEPGPDGKLLVIARYTAFDEEFGRAFGPDETAYVQDRL